MERNLEHTIKAAAETTDLPTHYTLLKQLQDLLTKQEATTLLFSQQELLEPFVVMLFNRRFGWSEEAETLAEDDHRSKRAINEAADEFLFYLRDQPLTASILHALAACVSAAASKPVVRKQTFKHFYDWIRAQADEDQELKDKLQSNFTAVQVLSSVHILTAGLNYTRPYRCMVCHPQSLCCGTTVGVHIIFLGADSQYF